MPVEHEGEIFVREPVRFIDEGEYVQAEVGSFRFIMQFRVFRDTTCIQQKIIEDHDQRVCEIIAHPTLHFERREQH